VGFHGLNQIKIFNIKIDFNQKKPVLKGLNNCLKSKIEIFFRKKFILIRNKILKNIFTQVFCSCFLRNFNLPRDY
jgi:hypothetical protein